MRKYLPSLGNNSEPCINFLEIFTDTPIEVCEQRDTKGLYEQAHKGQIKNFTGVNDPYEKPDSAEVVLRPAEMTTDECVKAIANEMESRSFICLSNGASKHE